jgi:hypothetical protein
MGLHREIAIYRAIMPRPHTRWQRWMLRHIPHDTLQVTVSTDAPAIVHINGLAQ